MAREREREIEREREREREREIERDKEEKENCINDHLDHIRLLIFLIISIINQYVSLQI